VVPTGAGAGESKESGPQREPLGRSPSLPLSGASGKEGTGAMEGASPDGGEGRGELSDEASP
jgi:hypothetical protein